MSRHYCTQCGVAPTLALRFSDVIYFDKTIVGLRRGVAKCVRITRLTGAPPRSGRCEQGRAASTPNQLPIRAPIAVGRAREVFAVSDFHAATAQKFPAPQSDPESRRAYFSELGRRSAAARRGGIVLKREEVAALVTALSHLRRALQRARRRCAAAEASPAHRCPTCGTDWGARCSD